MLWILEEFIRESDSLGSFCLAFKDSLLFFTLIIMFSPWSYALFSVFLSSLIDLLASSIRFLRLETRLRLPFKESLISTLFFFSYFSLWPNLSSSLNSDLETSLGRYEIESMLSFWLASRKLRKFEISFAGYYSLGLLLLFLFW